jgi:hypothetical protein
MTTQELVERLLELPGGWDTEVVVQDSAGNKLPIVAVGYSDKDDVLVIRTDDNG